MSRARQKRTLSRPPVAIAHDYLTQRGGAERVVLDIARTFPGAPIYTTLYDPDGTFPEFRDLDVIVSPLNRVGLLRRHHRLALPLLPLASHSIRIEADVVMVSSSGWAHGFSTGGAKIVYCHNPARWLYQTDEYLGSGRMAQVKRAAVAALRAPLTAWDKRAAHTADVYLSNSTVVRERIDAAYGIKADLLHPAAGVTPIGRQAEVDELWEWADFGYHLVVSRLLPYKNIAQVLRAVEGTEERLVVVGRGPELSRLQQVAPPNAMLLHGLSDAQMRWVYAHARRWLRRAVRTSGSPRWRPAPSASRSSRCAPAATWTPWSRVAPASSSTRPRPSRSGLPSPGPGPATGTPRRSRSTSRRSPRRGSAQPCSVWSTRCSRSRPSGADQMFGLAHRSWSLPEPNCWVGSWALPVGPLGRAGGSDAPACPAGPVPPCPGPTWP